MSNLGIYIGLYLVVGYFVQEYFFLRHLPKETIKEYGTSAIAITAIIMSIIWLPLMTFSILKFFYHLVKNIKGKDDDHRG